MGFRFRRSAKLFPGIRLNLSKSGVSVSVGPRGAKMTISSKGIRKTYGVPGTGLSHTSYEAFSSSKKTKNTSKVNGYDIEKQNQLKIQASAERKAIQNAPFFYRGWFILILFLVSPTVYFVTAFIGIYLYLKRRLYVEDNLKAYIETEQQDFIYSNEMNAIAQPPYIENSNNDFALNLDVNYNFELYVSAADLKVLSESLQTVMQTQNIVALLSKTTEFLTHIDRVYINYPSLQREKEELQKTLVAIIDKKIIEIAEQIYTLKTVRGQLNRINKMIDELKKYQPPTPLMTQCLEKNIYYLEELKITQKLISISK